MMSLKIYLYFSMLHQMEDTQEIVKTMNRQITISLFVCLHYIVTLLALANVVPSTTILHYADDTLFSAEITMLESAYFFYFQPIIRYGLIL